MLADEPVLAAAAATLVATIVSLPRPAVAKEMPSADWWDDIEIGTMLWAFRPNGSPYPPGSWEDLEYDDAIVRARDEAGAKDQERQNSGLL